MKTVILYGELRKKFGRQFDLDVASPAEAVRALCAQVKGFRAYLYDHTQDTFKLFVGGRNSSEELVGPCSDKEVIRIAPVIQGAGAAGKIVLGIVLIVISWWTGGATAGSGMAMFSSACGAAGWSMVIGGVVQLLTQTSSSKGGGADSAANSPSYNFNGPVNTEAQGHPVPLCYGRMIVGSAVISAGMTTS